MIETAADVLPRRWRRRIGLIVIGLLLATGKANEFVNWFITDKAAANEDQLIVPMMERLAETAAASSGPAAG